MIEIRPTVPSDIDYVVDNLWDRGIAEINKLGLEDKEKLKKCLHEKPLDYFSTMHIGEPVVILGVTRYADTKRLFTWFMATEKFTQYNRAITKATNQLIKENIVKEPGYRLELWSASDHPMADKWFQVLGFERLPERKNNCVAYLYVKNALDRKR